MVKNALGRSTGMVLPSAVISIVMLSASMAQPLYGTPSQNRPGVERQGDRKIDRSERRSNNAPAPLGRVETHDEADGAEARAERAEQYQRDDLVAQQTAASAAKRQADLALAQAVFGVIGIILLLGTLWYTRETARSATASAQSAHDALDQSRLAVDAAIASAKAAERGLALSEAQFAATNRAFISISLFQSGTARNSYISGKGPVDFALITPSMTNYGTTPARDVSTHRQVQFVRDGETPVWDEPEFEGHTTIVAPGVQGHWEPIIVERDHAMASLEKVGYIYFQLDIRYRDIYTEEFKYTRGVYFIRVRAPWETVLENPIPSLMVIPIGGALMT